MNKVNKVGVIMFTKYSSKIKELSAFDKKDILNEKFLKLKNNIWKFIMLLIMKLLIIMPEYL